MLMAIIFILLTIAVIVAWIGKRHAALTLFIISFVLTIIAFVHHMSDHLTIQL